MFLYLRSQWRVTIHKFAVFQKFVWILVEAKNLLNKPKTTIIVPLVHSEKNEVIKHYEYMNILWSSSKFSDNSRYLQRVALIRLHINTKTTIAKLHCFQHVFNCDSLYLYREEQIWWHSSLLCNFRTCQLGEMMET